MSPKIQRCVTLGKPRHAASGCVHTAGGGGEGGRPGAAADGAAAGG